MKKWVSALCAAACVLSLGTAAFAEEFIRRKLKDIF